VGVEQFDRQMALLRAHCHVLTLDQVLATHEVLPSDRPLVAVTFDDGYLDNYTHAAPSLRRHGIPAAFFVSTGLIGQDRRFPHDVRRGNPLIPTMTWPQLREMRDQGFTIGSHSVSHIDCAAESEDIVVAELRESRERLQHELGLSDVVFAYPYGGRQHMTAQRLQCVKDAGYVGCLSAYGGSNIGRIDRYNVLRRGIHWEFTEQAFLFECLGLR
jgi:peptidoglycan/xylan/chitin deacetylase (PgdA/CDA1 family)